MQLESQVLSYTSIADIARRMRDIEYAMLMTRTPQGHITGRPICNNRGEDYRGESCYFTWDDSPLVREIERDPKVALTFQGNRHILGTPGIQINVEGTARVVRDLGQFRANWTPELNRWFEQGVHTPGLVMIKVHARRVHYWEGADEGEIDVA